jgi:hypothetical protein
MNRRSHRLKSLVVAGALAAIAAPAAHAAAEPPLAASSNVHVLDHIPGTAAGMNFKGNYAFVSGWSGVTVLDISKPASPQIAGALPLPHFENEDVDLCGDTLTVVNDREAQDLGSVMYVIDISEPTQPTIAGVLPLGLTGSGRGSGHISNFVKPDCTQAWVDGGNLVEVVDLTVPSAPRSLGKFESAASQSDAFNGLARHRARQHGHAVERRRRRRGRLPLTRNPLAPQLLATTGEAGRNPSPYNDFILHNSQRRGKTLLVTRRTTSTPTRSRPAAAAAGQVRDLGSLAPEQGRDHAARHLGDGAQRHVHRRRGRLEGAGDGQLLVALVRRQGRRRGRRLVRAGRPLPRLPHATDIQQVGYYIPANGSTWAAYWSPTDPNGEIVYTADAYRGVDVLKIDGGGRTGKKVKAPVPAGWFGSPTADANVFEPHPVYGFMCPVLQPGIDTP